MIWVPRRAHPVVDTRDWGGFFAERHETAPAEDVDGRRAVR